MSIHLAFYKGKGKLIDRVIRFGTRSIYSHVEIVFNYGSKEQFCISSSPRDKGVRMKNIHLKKDNWDIISVLYNPIVSELLFVKSKGNGYDFLGIFFSQILNLQIHSKKRWFCSEYAAAFLNVINPERYSPGDLKDFVDQMNQAYLNGKNSK